MMFGLDCLGLAKYGSVVAREIPAGWALGAFSNTFGDAVPALKKVLLTGKVARCRIHLLWKDDHKFTSADIPKAVAEAKRVTPLIKEFPEVEFRVSPLCEHELNAVTAQKFMDAVRAVLPGFVVIVNCPTSKGAILKNEVNEIHGSKAKPLSGRFDFSFDGQSCEDADVTAIKARMDSAETFYFWGCRYNGKWEDNDSTPRPKRKGWPDSKGYYIRSHLAFIRDKQPSRLPARWLYKSHAENKDGKDPRAEKPVFIIPVRSSKVEIKASNGRLVQSLPYYSTYGDGRFRYYAKDWGYVIAEKAFQLSGSYICDVFVGGKKYGTIDPAFRQGEFR